MTRIIDLGNDGLLCNYDITEHVRSADTTQTFCGHNMDVLQTQHGRSAARCVASHWNPNGIPRNSSDLYKLFVTCTVVCERASGIPCVCLVSLEGVGCMPVGRSDYWCNSYCRFLFTSVSWLSSISLLYTGVACYSTAELDILHNISI